MAETDFTRVWFHLASDLTDSLELGLAANGWTSPRSGGGETRQLAAGRTVAVSRPGTTRAASVSVIITDRDQVSWLEEKINRQVLVRSPRGHRLWGVFRVVEVPEPTGRKYNVICTLSVSEVTVSEIV